MQFFFQQESAAAATKNFSVHCLESVFGDRMISRKLWYSCLLDLDLCLCMCVCVWSGVKGQLGWKHSGCSFTSRNSTCSELHVRCDVSMWAKGNHFQHL